MNGIYALHNYIYENVHAECSHWESIRAWVEMERGDKQVNLNWVHDRVQVCIIETCFTTAIAFVVYVIVGITRNGTFFMRNSYLFTDNLSFIYTWWMCTPNTQRMERIGFSFAFALSVAVSFAETLSNVDSPIRCNLENCVNKFLAISVQHRYIKITANILLQTIWHAKFSVWTNILTNVIHSNCTYHRISISYRYRNKNHKYSCKKNDEVKNVGIQNMYGVCFIEVRQRDWMHGTTKYVHLRNAMFHWFSLYFVVENWWKP